MTSATTPPAVDSYDENMRVRNRITIGALLESISEEHLGDRHASPDELLRVADVGKDLLYAALGHRDATSAVLDEAREHWGPLVDVALREISC